MDITLASIKAANFARYISMASAHPDSKAVVSWELNEAISTLQEIAPLLGFDLVPREAKKEAA